MGRIVLGIAGGTGSGKTTIAKNIIKSLPIGKAILLQCDSYYKNNSHLSFDERSKLNYDHPDAIDFELLLQHLGELKSGRAIKKPCYDFVRHKRKSETELVESKSVIVVEGILLFFNKQLQDIFDLKLFVDTAPDIRVVRRIRRDMEKRGRTFDSVREQYYSTVRPMHMQFVEPSKVWADLIIPEGGDNKIAIDVIVENLKQYF